MIRTTMIVVLLAIAAGPTLSSAQDTRENEAAPSARVEDAKPLAPGEDLVRGQHVDAPAAPGAPEKLGPDTDNGRYALNKMSDSFLRLDTRTGQVSLCKQGDTGWTCQAVPDERAALEGEIKRLQGEIASLKKELAARTLPSPPQTEPAPKKPPELRLPSDEDLERMMVFMEKMWKRLIDMVQNVQKSVEKKS